MRIFGESWYRWWALSRGFSQSRRCRLPSFEISRILQLLLDGRRRSRSTPYSQPLKQNKQKIWHHSKKTNKRSFCQKWKMTPHPIIYQYYLIKSRYFFEKKDVNRLKTYVTQRSERILIDPFISPSAIFVLAVLRNALLKSCRKGPKQAKHHIKKFAIGGKILISLGGATAWAHGDWRGRSPFVHFRIQVDVGEDVNHGLPDFLN